MRRRGFTMIELLVVIVIAGVLTSISLPTLMGARESAKRASCLANLRSMGGAMAMYMNANDVIPFAEFPVDVPRGFSAPQGALAEFLDVEPPSVASDGSMHVGSPWQCPSDNEFGQRTGWSYVYMAYDLIALEGAHSADPLKIVTRIFELHPNMPLIIDAKGYHDLNVPAAFPAAFGARNVMLLDGSVEQGDAEKHLAAG